MRHFCKAKAAIKAFPLNKGLTCYEAIQRKYSLPRENKNGFGRLQRMSSILYAESTINFSSKNMKLFFKSPVYKYK